MNPSRVPSFSLDYLDLPSLICRHLQFPNQLTIGMEVKLEKILLYETGDYDQRAFYSKEIGIVFRL